MIECEDIIQDMKKLHGVIEPFELIYLEEFKNRQEARIKEKYLKSGVGKEFLKRISSKS